MLTGNVLMNAEALCAYGG